MLDKALTGSRRWWTLLAVLFAYRERRRQHQLTDS